MEDDEQRIYLDRSEFRFKYPDLMDEWNSSLNGVEVDESITQTKQSRQNVNTSYSTTLETNFSDFPKIGTSTKDIRQELIDVRKKNKNDQVHSIDGKRGKSIKVQSFLRTLGIRILKAFQPKDS